MANPNRPLARPLRGEGPGGDKYKKTRAAPQSTRKTPWRRRNTEAQRPPSFAKMQPPPGHGIGSNAKDCMRNGRAAVLCFGVPDVLGGLARAFWGRPCLFFLNFTPPWGVVPALCGPRLFPLQNGETAVMFAAYRNHLASVKALLGTGARVDLKNTVSPAWTAEHRARPVWYGWGSGGPIVWKVRVCIWVEKRLERPRLWSGEKGRGAVLRRS